MMSEVLLPANEGAPRDSRADVFNNSGDPRWSFTTITTPNSTVPDRLPECETGASRPAQNLPCVQLGNPNQAAPRSQHTGGVHVAMCDGAVRFLSDFIDLAVFRALGSSKGGESAQFE
jgi:prepilin-type processing-associated H-X9-DG protein